MPRYTVPRVLPRIAPADAFEAHVNRRGEDECWIWTGNVTGPTWHYGRIATYDDTGKRRWIMATHFAWETFVGPIPEGHRLLHRCDTPLCVNYVRHLWTGTNADNVADRDAKGRAEWQRPGGWSVGQFWTAKTHCPQGHEYTPENTKRVRNGGRGCRACIAERLQRHREAPPRSCIGCHRLRRIEARARCGTCYARWLSSPEGQEAKRRWTKRS